MQKYSVDGVLSYESMLMSEPLETEAESSRKAVEKYLESKNINLERATIKYGGDNAQVQVLPFKIGKDGKKYADGRATWWTVTRTK